MLQKYQEKLEILKIIFSSAQPHLVSPVAGDQAQFVFTDGSAPPGLGQEAETGAGFHLFRGRWQLTVYHKQQQEK